MKTNLIFVFILIVPLIGCDEKIVYKDDPRLYNDAYHGAIVGKVLQTGVEARVVVNQETPVDSTDVDSETGVFRIENLPIGNYDLTILTDGFRTYTRSNVVVEGAGNTYIGEVDLSTVPDIVAGHYPEDTDEIVFGSSGGRISVSIAFTQPMDRESVEEAFSTDPPSEGIFNWGNFVYVPTDDNKDYWDDNAPADGGGATITTYSKITAFTYQLAQKDSHSDTTYEVELSTAAMDTSGNYLRFPLKFSFSTVQSASTYEGIQTVPSHGDIDVGLISNNGIQITFPRNMNGESVESSITMTPDVERIFIWPAKNQLTIYTGGPYKAETEYTIRIDGDALDLDGATLGEDFSFSFTTETVKITQTTPRNGELFVQYDEPYVTMWFNTYMVKSTIETAFDISPPVSGTLKWGTRNSSYDAKTTLTFVPNDALKPNTKYTVTVDTSAEDLYGSHLKEPCTFSFITRPE